MLAAMKSTPLSRRLAMKATLRDRRSRREQHGGALAAFFERGPELESVVIAPALDLNEFSDELAATAHEPGDPFALGVHAEAGDALLVGAHTEICHVVRHRYSLLGSVQGSTAEECFRAVLKEEKSAV
jgi:hypothetical protein